MATTPVFEAFVPNGLAVQAMNEQFFDNLVMMGIIAVSMLKGGQPQACALTNVEAALVPEWKPH